MAPTGDKPTVKPKKKVAKKAVKKKAAKKKNLTFIGITITERMHNGT